MAAPPKSWALRVAKAPDELADGGSTTGDDDAARHGDSLTTSLHDGHLKR